MKYGLENRDRSDVYICSIVSREGSECVLDRCKVVMSTRLVEIQNEILRKFDTYNEKEMIQRMFYRNLDQLGSIQDKISYLMMIIDQVDSDRICKYLSNFPQHDLQPETDTSTHHIQYKMQNQVNSQTQHHLINSNNQHETYLNKLKNTKPNPVNYQTKLNINNQTHSPQPKKPNLDQNPQRNHLSNHYSQISHPSLSRDQTIISNLSNSQSSSLYEHVTELHRSKKSQNYLNRTQSLLRSQKIKKQLKNLQIAKKICKFQHKPFNPHTYSQSINPILYQTQTYPQLSEKYPHQTEKYPYQREKYPYKTKTYPSSPDKNNYGLIGQAKKDSKNRNEVQNDVQDLFSFRTAQNPSKNKQKSRQQRDQSPSQVNEQKLNDFRRPNYKFSSEDDLIYKLNRNITQENSLNSILSKNSSIKSNRRDPLVSSYNQNLAKLSRLQQERFLQQKQEQLRKKQFDLSLYQSELKKYPVNNSSFSQEDVKEKLKQFKTWLKNQNTPLSQNKLSPQMQKRNKEPSFIFRNDKNEMRQLSKYLSETDKKPYICYSESQIFQSSQIQNSDEKSEQKGSQFVSVQNKRNFLNKRAKLIISEKKKTNSRTKHIKQEQKHPDYELGKNNKVCMRRKRNESKSCQKCRSGDKKGRSRDKLVDKVNSSAVKQYQNEKDVLKSRGKIIKFGQRENKEIKSPQRGNKEIKSPQRGNRELKEWQQIERQGVQKVNSELLFRVNSSPYLIEEVLYPLYNSNQNQLLQRHLIDQKRLKQTKQKIIQQKQEKQKLIQKKQETQKLSYLSTF